MAKTIRNITLDVSAENDFVYYAKQGDANSRFLKIKLANQCTPIVPEKTDSVVFTGKRADGKSIVGSGTINPDGTITVEFTSSMLAVIGEGECEVSIVSQNGAVLTSLSFVFAVEEKLRDDNSLASSNEFPIFTKAIGEMSKLKNELDASEEARNVFEEYNSEKDYVVGNKVAFGGSGYVCIKDCCGIDPTDPEFWLLFASKGDKGDTGASGLGKKSLVNGGEIFNDYEGNESNIPFHHIEGKNNKAVVKCFMIKGFTENTITLDSVEGIEVGMMWNIFIEDETDEKGYRKLRGTISTIEGNTCTLENDAIPVTLVTSGVVASDEPIFYGTFIVNGGTIGTETISDIENPNFYLHMSGEGNIGYLNCQVRGTGNKGLAFNAVIDGYFCEVYAERGIAIQYRCVVGPGAESAFAGGHTTHVYAVGGFSHGYMCLLTKLASWGQAFGDHTVSNARGQFVAGLWNIIDEAQEFLFIIGNGTSEENRSNAFTVDKQGNARAAGKVYAEGKELATKESVDNLNKSKGMVFKGVWNGSVLPNTMLDDKTPNYEVVGNTYKLKNETRIEGYAHRLVAGVDIKFFENDPNYLVTCEMRSKYLEEDRGEFTKLLKILGIVDMDFQLTGEAISIPCDRYVEFHVTTSEATGATFTGEYYTANITTVEYDDEANTIRFKGSWVKSPPAYRYYNHPKVAYATDNIYNAYSPYVGYYKPLPKTLNTYPEKTVVTYNLTDGWVDF